MTSMFIAAGLIKLNISGDNILACNDSGGETGTCILS